MITILAALIIGLGLVVGVAYLYHRYEWKAVLPGAAAVILMTVVSGEVTGLPFVIAPLVLGTIGGYTFKKGKSFTFFLVTAAFSLAVLFGVYFYAMVIFEKVDFVGMLRGELVRFLNTARAPEDIKSQFLSDFDGSKDDIIARVPFSSFLNAVILAGLAFVAVRKFFSRLPNAEPVAGLEYFKLNEYFIFVLIAGLGIYLLIDKAHYSAVSNAGLNAVLISALLYFVQALGIVKFHLIKRGAPTYILPLALVTMTIMGIWILFFLFVLLAGFGTLDVWADFRKLSKQDAGGSGEN